MYSSRYQAIRHRYLDRKQQRLGNLRAIDLVDKVVSKDQIDQADTRNCLIRPINIFEILVECPRQFQRGPSHARPLGTVAGEHEGRFGRSRNGGAAATNSGKNAHQRSCAEHQQVRRDDRQQSPAARPASPYGALTRWRSLRPGPAPALRHRDRGTRHIAAPRPTRPCGHCALRSNNVSWSPPLALIRRSFFFPIALAFKRACRAGPIITWTFVPPKPKLLNSSQATRCRNSLERNRLNSDLQIEIVEGDMRIERLNVKGRRKHTVLKRKLGLEQADQTRRRLEMSDIGFRRADRQP